MYKKGKSYQKRAETVKRIYEEHAHSGLSSREIWRRFIYPETGVTERTMYNLLVKSFPDEKR